jgi:hypothetical protein
VNETTWELDLIRTQLRAAIERDLDDRSPRPRVAHRRSFLLAIPTLAVLAIAIAAIVLGLTVSAASPSSASAAAKRALAATAAAPSGTMTTTVLHAGVTRTVDAARWNGSDIAFSPGLGPIPQLLLIGGGMYVQTSDGSWLHYADASNVGPKPLGGLDQLAHDSIAGTTPQQILALATHVQKTAQADGTTLYAGTIPYGSLDPAVLTGNDAITNMILGAQKRTAIMSNAGNGNKGEAPGGQPSDLQLQMSVGGDGLVKQVSATFQQTGTGSPATDGAYTWSVTYSQLGSTPPITAPPTSTEVPPGTLPPGTLPPEPKPDQNGGQNLTPTITPADQTDYRNAAKCMRSHGVPDFPDPTFANNTVHFNIPGNIDPNSSQAKTAEAICVKLIPPGLPYSGSSPGLPSNNSHAPRG